MKLTTGSKVMSLLAGFTGLAGSAFGQDLSAWGYVEFTGDYAANEAAACVKCEERISAIAADSCGSGDYQNFSCHGGGVAAGTPPTMGVSCTAECGD